MPQGFIESTNISISGINNLKDIHTDTSSTSPNSSIDALRNWFRDNIGDTGGFNNTSASGTRVDFSDFNGATIYGFYARGESETTSKYANTNNGWVTFTSYAGDGNRLNFSFFLNGRGWITPNTSNNTGTSFHNLNSGDYQCYIKHRTLPQIGFVITIGYGGGATNLTYSGKNTNGGPLTSINDIRTTAKLFVIDDKRTLRSR